MKRLFNLVLVFFVALLFVSCDLLEDDSKSGPKAPDMGSPADLAISGVTRSPASIQECNEMFLYVIDAIKREQVPVALPKFVPNLSVIGVKSTSRAVVSTNDPISWIVGDSIAVTGFYKEDEFTDDRLLGTGQAPYGNYDPAETSSFEGEVTGIFTNAKLGFAGYTVNGKIVRNGKGSFKLGYNISPTSKTMYIRISEEIVLGTALSIVTPNGVGAKFILSYANAYGFSGDHNTQPSEFDVYSNSINNSEIHVEVYDLNNQHIFTSYLTLGQL